MRSRLGDLRKAAALPEKPAGAALQADPPPKDPYLEQLFENAHSLETVCKDIRSRVQSLRSVTVRARTAVLPKMIKDLKDEFDSEDAVCQRLVKWGKTLLKRVQDGPQDISDEEEEVYRSMRGGMASHLNEHLREVVMDYFDARHAHVDEAKQRNWRRLKFAYPAAEDDALALALGSPELASAVLERRLERGEEDLEVVLKELSNDSVQNARKLAEEARDLKMLFVEFAQLVGAQGETMKAIEANIDSMLTNVTAADEHLREARSLHASNWRKDVKQKCCCFVVTVIIIVVVFGGSLEEWLIHLRIHPTKTGLHATHKLLEVYSHYRPLQFQDGFQDGFLAHGKSLHSAGSEFSAPVFRVPTPAGTVPAVSQLERSRQQASSAVAGQRGDDANVPAASGEVHGRPSAAKKIQIAPPSSVSRSRSRASSFKKSFLGPRTAHPARWTRKGRLVRSRLAQH